MNFRILHCLSTHNLMILCTPTRIHRRIQTAWRRKSAWKKWHPIIMIRLKIGKRAYYRLCWGLWLQYNRIVRRIKETIQKAMASHVNLCFYAWKKFSADNKSYKLGIMQRFASRVKNSGLVIHLLNMLFSN